MPVTIAAIEHELIGRVGGLMAGVGMDATTQSGNNPDLRGPIRRAVLVVQGATADPIIPSDGDVATVAGWAVERLLDIATLQLLENAAAKLLLFDQAAGQDQQRLSQLNDQIMKLAEHYKEKLAQPYGPSLPGSFCAPTGAPTWIPNDPQAWPRDRTSWLTWPYMK